MRTYAQQKGALTRALKAGPEAVLAEVERVEREWDESGWPDNWHRWNIARWDAEWEIARRWED
jgi:hypothetical protein